MKYIVNIFVAIALAIAVIPALIYFFKREKKIVPPENVITSFNQKFKGIDVIEWLLRMGHYYAYYEENGIYKGAVFDKTGKLLERREWIDFSDIPYWLQEKTDEINADSIISVKKIENAEGESFIKIKYFSIDNKIAYKHYELIEPI